MDAALALAGRGLGRVWPNPAVGCVLVRPDLGGRVVGRGWTQPGGRPHAETEALKRAGSLARGATAYVTLEPCAHHGKTPPCADALIAAGIARAVVALEDPDPRTAGQGVARLREAGIDVTSGVRAEAAAEVNEGFLMRLRHGRPTVTLKIASSLDGRIAAEGGDSRWITDDMARRHGHALRAAHDAVLVGVGTALADDPELTCRLPGVDWNPVRVVMDSRLRLSPECRLVTGAATIRTWVVTTVRAEPSRADLLTEKGVELLTVDAVATGQVDPEDALEALAARGLTRVLIEGGGAVAAAFVAAGLVDRIAWFRAPILMGAAGVPAIADLNVLTPADAPGFARVGAVGLGVDTLETFRRQA